MPGGLHPLLGVRAHLVLQERHRKHDKLVRNGLGVFEFKKTEFCSIVAVFVAWGIHMRLELSVFGLAVAGLALLSFVHPGPSKAQWLGETSYFDPNWHLTCVKKDTSRNCSSKLFSTHRPEEHGQPCCCNKKNVPVLATRKEACSDAGSFEAIAIKPSGRKVPVINPIF